MSPHVSNQRGLTLLELLLVMMILSVVMIAMFQIINVNYSTMHDALEGQEERDNLRIFNTYVIQDVANSSYVTIQNESTFDVLVYTDVQGASRVVKFAHEDGIYEIENGEEKLVANASAWYPDTPMVYEKDGLVYFNVYAKETNVLLDFAIMPRVHE